MTTYLGNGFSPSMLGQLPISVVIYKINGEQFCESIKEDVTNAIGHDSTVRLVNVLCGTNFIKNRIEIKLNAGDTLYLVALKDRLPEGKILTDEEIKNMYAEGKVDFYEVFL